MRYAEYLQTDHWRRVREAALRRQPRCAMCGRESGLRVHHNSYDRLWAEEPEDLCVVCGDCHERHHLNHVPEEVEESASDFWPVVRMEDGTLRRGPRAEIVGRGVVCVH